MVFFSVSTTEYLKKKSLNCIGFLPVGLNKDTKSKISLQRIVVIS